MRLRSKVDGNHSAIVRALRRIGCQVIDLSRVGGGCPDLLVWRKATGRITLLECKSPKGKLTVDQERVFANWPVRVVRSAEDAIGAVK